MGLSETDVAKQVCYSFVFFKINLNILNLDSTYDCIYSTRSSRKS